MEPLQSNRVTISRRKCQHIRLNVQGAPFRIGQAVRICQLTDETALRRLLGRLGTVEHFEYSCGCGQSYPGDPMIGVRLANGEIDEFWAEELERVENNRVRRREFKE